MYFWIHHIFIYDFMQLIENVINSITPKGYYTRTPKARHVRLVHMFSESTTNSELNMPTLEIIKNTRVFTLDK